jgi:hypothetical protein
MEAIRPAVLPNPQPRRASEAASSGELEGSLVVFNLYYSRMKNLPQIAPLERRVDSASHHSFSLKDGAVVGLSNLQQ